MSGGVDRKRSGDGPGRIAVVWEAMRASFGFLSGLAMVLGILLGLLLPWADEALNVNLPVLTFDGQSSARSLLETIATATVSVAGLSFSVTVVAFTLASQQLSPRVLRSFRSDRLSQVTLALFLGTFVYCLTLLVRLGVSGEGAEPPNVSVTLAVLLAFGAFTTFAGFIAHVVSMLQPSSVISAVAKDAVSAIEGRYPAGPGKPEDEGEALRLAHQVAGRQEARPVRAEKSGFLTVVRAGAVISAATDAGVMVSQKICIGEYVLMGQTIAEYRISGPDAAPDDDFANQVRCAYELGDQRTLVQDIAFPVRQLADIALKGLSPGINDPTTAENAMDSLAAFLIEFTGSKRPSPVRVDEDGEPRFETLAPDLDYLVKLGFGQVILAAADHPAIMARLGRQLDLIGEAARQNGVPGEECERQWRSIADATE